MQFYFSMITSQVNTEHSEMIKCLLWEVMGLWLYFQGFVPILFSVIGKEKENSALLSTCCLSAQKSWGSGATMSTADSLCLKSSPANQNSF